MLFGCFAPSWCLGGQGAAKDSCFFCTSANYTLIQGANKAFLKMEGRCKRSLQKKISGSRWARSSRSSLFFPQFSISDMKASKECPLACIGRWRCDLGIHSQFFFWRVVGNMFHSCTLTPSVRVVFNQYMYMPTCAQELPILSYFDRSALINLSMPYSVWSVSTCRR